MRPGGHPGAAHMDLGEPAGIAGGELADQSGPAGAERAWATSRQNRASGNAANRRSRESGVAPNRSGNAMFSSRTCAPSGCLRILRRGWHAYVRGLLAPSSPDWGQ